MLDFKNGVQIIEGCDFKLSAATSFYDVKKELIEYMIHLHRGSSSGLFYIVFACDKTLNFEDKNHITLSFDNNDTLVAIEIKTLLEEDYGDYYRNDSRIAKTIENCRKWLAANCPIGRYDFGDVKLVKEIGQYCFVGIRILLRCEYNNKRFSEPFYSPIGMED